MATVNNAKTVSKAQRIATGAAKQKARAHKEASKDQTLDDVIYSFVDATGKNETSAMALAIRFFKEFDNWDCNDPNSPKPKTGTSWVAAVDGSAYTENEKARKAMLQEVKAKIKELAIIHCPTNVNSPWSRIVKAANVLLGGNAKGPDLSTSNDKAKADLLRIYRRNMKDQSLNEEGQNLNTEVGRLLVSYFKVDITKY